MNITQDEPTPRQVQSGTERVLLCDGHDLAVNMGRPWSCVHVAPLKAI
jgi:hypothetical protein